MPHRTVGKIWRLRPMKRGQPSAWPEPWRVDALPCVRLRSHQYAATQMMHDSTEPAHVLSPMG